MAVLVTIVLTSRVWEIISKKGREGTDVGGTISEKKEAVPKFFFFFFLGTRLKKVNKNNSIFNEIGYEINKFVAFLTKKEVKNLNSMKHFDLKLTSFSVSSS